MGVADAICETLFYTQRSQYNTLYYAQSFLTFLYTLSITLDEVFPWHEGIMKHIRMFFQVISIPWFTLPTPAVYIFWGIVLAGIIFSWVCFLMVARGLTHDGDLEQRWLGLVLRLCLAFISTFWITVVRTLYVFVACNDHTDPPTSILLPEFECAGAGLVVLGVSVAFIVAFWALYTIQFMTHEINGRSFNALARTGCDYDFTHAGWLVAIVTTGLVNRPFYRDDQYDLNVPYAVGGVLMVGGLHQLTMLCYNQPYYSTKMNDLKAAFAAGYIWNGVVVLVISIMYKLMEKDHSGPGQGMNDFSEEIRLAITIGFLVLLPAVMYLGAHRSKAVRNSIVQKKLDAVQPLVDEMAALEEERDALQKDAPTNAKLSNTAHNPDDDKLWETVHDRFIPGIGITSSQVSDAVETEIASRFLLSDLLKLGHNLKSRRYACYKDAASDLNRAKTIFIQYLTPADRVLSCQSVYLMLQYIRFCMVYQLIPPIVAAKKVDDIMDKYSDELSFCTKLLLWRLKRNIELAKRRDSHHEFSDGSADPMALGFEEIKKNQRIAMEHHKASVARMNAVWKYLEKSASSLNANKVLFKMLERTWQAEKGATQAYLYVLDKASADVETLHKFAVFQMTVKKDQKIATELKSVADSIGDASMQQSASNGSGKGGNNRLDFLQEIRVNLTANALISQIRLYMSITTAVLIVIVSILFIVYLVLIDQYKSNLISLTESGSRSYYSMALALNVRDMHAYAIADDVQNYNRASSALYKNCREFSDLHVHLIHTYRTSYAEQQEFYKVPQEYINVKIPLAPAALVSSGKVVRNTRLSGMDIAFRLITAASEVQKSRPVDFMEFDASDPASFAALWYVLENAHITAKAMDHSTIIYVYEATDIAQMMAIVFIALSAVAILTEATLVLFVFHKNVQNLFDSMYGTGQGAQEIVNQCLADAEIVDLVLSKNNKNRNKRMGEERTQARAKAKQLDDDDDSASDDADAIDEAQQQDNSTQELDDMHDDDDVQDTTDMAQYLLKLFYYTCLTVITACLCTLCALCYQTVSKAEASANDLNNGSRRRYIDGRVLYLTKELLYSVNEAQSLVGGTLTWLNSTALIRCMLRRAGYALLSSHYSLIYGGVLGFKSMATQQNWLGGNVRSWLVEGWTGPLPSQQQIYGYESPPKWDETGGDYCTPFTWSHTHFEKGTEMKGALGNSELQDSIYFTSNCFTDLELQESIVLTDPRIKFFSDQMRPDQCYGFRSDILLCADMERQAAQYPPKPQVDRFEVEGCQDDELVMSCGVKMRGNKQCDAQELEAYTDCQVADRRRKCDQARRGTYDEKKCRIPITGAPDPSCNPMIDFGNGMIAPRDGVQRDSELGISDLDFYNSQFKASFTHADIKPQDPIMTMGLHTLINFFMDNAISIANDPIENINPDSTFFHRIYKYANGELQSGQEIAGGLFKSILIAQHDVLTSMDNNTSITIIAFAVILLVVLLQLAFLSGKIRSVVVDYFGMTSIIVRILNEIASASEELEARKTQEGVDMAKGKGGQGDMAQETSEEDLDSSSEVDIHEA